MVERRPWVSSLGLLLGSLLAFAVTSGPVAAQSPTERARRHFDAGTEAFETGDYERAVVEFRRAHDLTEHPDLLYNVYSSAERAGRLEEAASALETYLAQAEVASDERAVLEQRLLRLRQRVTARAPAVPPPDAAPAGSGPHPAAIGTLIGAGALTVAFAVLAALSEVEDQGLAATCGRDTTRSCTDAELSTLQSLNLAADVSWIGAAVAGAVGAVLLLVLPGEGGTATQTALAPWASPDGGGVMVRARW